MPCSAQGSRAARGERPGNLRLAGSGFAPRSAWVAVGERGASGRIRRAAPSWGKKAAGGARSEGAGEGVGGLGALGARNPEGKECRHRRWPLRPWAVPGRDLQSLRAGFPAPSWVTLLHILEGPRKADLSLLAGNPRQPTANGTVWKRCGGV